MVFGVLVVPWWRRVGGLGAVVSLPCAALKS